MPLDYNDFRQIFKEQEENDERAELARAKAETERARADEIRRRADRADAAEKRKTQDAQRAAQERAERARIAAEKAEQQRRRDNIAFVLGLFAVALPIVVALIVFSKLIG